jgi:hypothetical protein
MLETARYPNPKQVILFPPAQRTKRYSATMRTAAVKQPPSQKILIALAEYSYLTALQITRLLYSPGSLTYVKDKLKSLVDTGYALPLAGRRVNLPLIYTLSGEGRSYAAFLGISTGKRFRPSEEHEKADNFYFMRHTLAVNDILIAARLLAETVPGIILNRMIQERDLKRKIYVEVPQVPQENRRTHRKISIEPDAGLDFTIEETWHQQKQTWQDFFHIEVYRTLPPVAWRFKQKVHGYVALAQTGQHEELFQTPALSIAVFAATVQQKAVLKRWTEEALREMPREGQRFFFTSIETAAASPTEMYLSPVWQQAFGEAPIPLLVYKEGHAQ